MTKNDFLLFNVNAFELDILLCCSYLSEIDSPEVKALYKNKKVYYFSPEMTHADKLGFKLCTILRIGKVKTITVLSKDGSPHSLQIPMMVQEAAENTGFDKTKIEYLAWEKGKLFPISDEAIRKARHLNEIEALLPLGQLQKTVNILRTQCPNDQKETFESILEHFIEEIQELKVEVQKKNSNTIQEELGDILFNVFLFSQIAEEKKLFSLTDLLRSANKKMIQRHSSIFEPKQ